MTRAKKPPAIVRRGLALCVKVEYNTVKPSGKDVDGLPAENKLRVELDKAQLDALTGKFERLGALVNEVNSILKGLSQNEIAVSLTVDEAD